MKTINSIFLIFLSLNIKNVQAQITSDQSYKHLVPKNFNILTTSPANGKSIQPITSLFDQDLKVDTILIAKHNDDFAHFILLFKLSSQSEISILRLPHEIDLNIHPLPLSLKKNVITLGYYIDGTAAFGRFLKLRYDSATNKIRLIGYDSKYKISPTKRCIKSYNLLTGDYEVKIIDLNHSKTIANRGNTKTEATYLHQINDQLFVLLDAIGSQYEE